MDESTSPYELNDKCIVLWKDGNHYAGRVQKIYEPGKDALRVSSTKKGKVVEDLMQVKKLRRDRANYVPVKVLTEARATDERHYYVHYQGWGPSYDEWLPIERMHPYTPNNVALMEQNKAPKDSEKQEIKLKKRDRELEQAAPKSKSKSSTEQQPLQKKRRVVLDEGRPLELKLSVPLELKRILVKDWELVTRDREILQLPRPLCVKAILKEFVESFYPVDDGLLENLNQFYESMLTYFDYTFGMMLLYRFERNQYYLMKKEQMFRPSLVYGAEHLARLLVILPAHLSQMQNMDDITMKFIVEKCEELAAFMVKRKNRFFAGGGGYDAATRVYQIQNCPRDEEGAVGIANNESD